MVYISSYNRTFMVVWVQPTCVAMTDMLRTERQGESELIDAAREHLERTFKRSVRSDYAKKIADEAEQVSNRYGARISINADETDELKALQDTLDIAEDHIREMQDDADLQRLHPSRRAEFVKEILEARMDERADEQLEAEADEIQLQAREQVEALFDQNAETVEISFRQSDTGSFTPRSVDRQDSDRPDATVTIENATTDMDVVDARLSADVVVLEDSAEVTVESSAGEQTTTLDRGAHSISLRSLPELAEEAGLIEREKRDAACQSSDKRALDVVIEGGESDKAHVIELQTGDGGYSRRQTEGWTEYRDFDAEREMLLVTVGQASYYKNRIRGKGERTWLIGRDENQIWAQQVQNPHETVEEALEFMIPAEVQRHEDDGREVIRQGDVFFSEMVRSSNFDALDGTRHEVEEQDESVVIRHPEHDDLELDGRWKAHTNIDGSRPRGSRHHSRD